ncbi:MAG: endonuclease/exonuclease/phosphatase family protein [Phormidesmis sp.]
MKMLLKGLGLLVGLPTAAIALFYLWGTSGSYSKQKYADIQNDYERAGAQAGEQDDLPAAPPAAKDSYTIVSYNLGYLSGLANNTTIETDRAFFEANQQRVISAFQAIAPDIIALQEVDFDSKRSYGVDQAKALALGLNPVYAGAIAISWDKNYVPFPFWPPSAHFGKILSGQAILSRYPIAENSRIVLEKVASNPFYYNAFYLDRLAQVSQIQLAGQTLVVISVHLEAFDEPTRVSQTRFVRSLAEDYAKTYPVIVLGDFNSSLNRTDVETEFSIKEMAASEQFVSAVPEADWGKAAATFPSDQPEYKLDYIWYTPSTIEAIKTEVVSAAGEASDHLPLMMNFRLK